jgi:AcrR family transcriptional regulator
MKSDDTHKTIVHKAIDLVSRLGFEKITVDAICKEAGIARSTFYNHFTSIEAVILEHFSLRRYLSQEELVWVLSAPSAYEKMVRVHLGYMSESKMDKLLPLFNINLRFCLNNADPKNLDSSKYMKELLLPLIKQAQDNGEILNTLNPEQLCDAAEMMHWGNLFMWCFSNGALERTTSIKKALEALYQPRDDLKEKV